MIPDKLNLGTFTNRRLSLFEVAVEKSFNFLSQEYATLFEASAATAFQHPAWLNALYRRLLQHNRAQPLVVTVRRSADRSLALVLPLVRQRYGALNVIEFADLRVSDYISAVADNETFAAIVADNDTTRQILAALHPYDILRLGKVKDGALPLHELFRVPAAKAMSTRSYAAPLGASFDDWRTTRLKQSYRKELDKKLRQLNRKGEVRFECVTDSAAVASTFDALKIFRRDRFELNGGGELLQIPAYFDFYTALARQHDFTRTYALTIDGRPVAAALGLMHRGALLVVLGGFTQTEFKNQSIGSLLFQEIARDCIARGESLLDFTIGDEPYKLTFGAEPMPMWQVTRAGSPLGYLAGALVEKLPAAKALARNIFRRGTDKRPAPAHNAAPPLTDEEPVEASLRS